RVGGTLEPGDDGIRDADAGDVAAHPARGPRRSQRADPYHEVAALVEAPIAEAREELAERLDVEAELRLDEARAGVDLLGQARHLDLRRHGEGIGRGAEEERRRPIDSRAGKEPALVAQGAERGEQRGAVEIEHRLGLGLIAAADA